MSRKKPKHISQVASKTAQYLEKTNMIDDWYHNNIQLSAKSQPFDSVYGGQGQSGLCWWHTAKDWSLLNATKA